MRLPLGRTASHAREDFIASPANAAALAALDTWPNWPGGRLAIIGPEGSGKTHLARAWAQSAGAVVLGPGPVDTGGLAGRAVLLEDADQRPADEALFHLINMADAGGSLLMTARVTPLDWPTRLPDLRSRLNALMVARLDPPDDMVLIGVLRKFFRDRNIRPEDDVLPYLVRRIERSVPAAFAVVARIDDAADAAGRGVTRAFAREIIEREAPALELPYS